MRSPSPTRRRRRALSTPLALALLLAPLAACSADDGDGAAAGRTTTSAAPAGATTTTTAPRPEPQELAADADLYAVPDPLPDGEHGDLLRHQRVEPSIAEGATTWRILYLSESVAGEPIAVSGVAIVPDGPAADGGRPILTLAHGTTGVADACTPSKEPGSELLLTRGVVADGWLAVMSDYEGLGTPGRHPYLVGESEGRAVLDAARAAAQLPGADAGNRLAIAGYSQGGHGALWANQLAGEWTPELEVVGTFAGAPATEIDIILAAAPRLPVAGFAYMIIAGFAAAYPDADPALILTEAGLDRLDEVDAGCGPQVIAAFAGSDPAELIRPDGPASEPWARLAGENNPGHVATEAPVLIIHSERDQVVPIALSSILLQRMCGTGQVVERQVLAEGGHVDAAPGAYATALTWLADRMAGTGEPVDTCATAR